MHKNLIIEPGSTILFTGDSITDHGRRADAPPLGSGYVRMVADLLDALYPEHNLQYINTGISGHTVNMLSDRWTEDAINHQPDWLSVMIGINDVHHWLGDKPTGSDAETFAACYNQLLMRVRAETSARLILMVPFYVTTIAPDPNGELRPRVMHHLTTYRAATRELAREYDALLVDTHALFQDLLKRHPAERFPPEPVHPNPAGHLVMASAWLRAVGAF
ncbi:MAG: SGNH/GDSL hydrolase family protein [Verrucomicrobia bacterium]|nr:SGNH/GDSL hydrolase family protein [Verrucomicrobiota bacterium]